CNAHPADRVRGGAGDLAIPEADRASTRPQRAGDQIERRALAGAVGTDEPENLALADLEGNLVDRQKSVEALGQPRDREHLKSSHRGTSSAAAARDPQS